MLCPVSRLSFLSLFSIDRMMQNWWTCCTDSKTAVTVVWPSLVVVPSGSSTWMSRSSKVRAQLGWSRGGWRWEGSVWCMVTHSSICRVSLSLVHTLSHVLSGILLFGCHFWGLDLSPESSVMWSRLLLMCRKLTPLCGFVTSLLVLLKQTFTDVQKTQSTVWFCDILACTLK